ncbi:MAG TPA: hypothetical protein VEH04_16905 [Verrucomicrobiae bacterium]|nr:hypothetical protein [Verrucomicrobiae bacterium]
MICALFIVALADTVDWRKSDWFAEWQRLARRDYHGVCHAPLFHY